MSITNKSAEQLTLADTLPIIRQIALEAGELLLHHRQKGFTVNYKSGPEDPVTIADIEASQLITSRLQQVFPNDGLLSEEEVDNSRRLDCPRVWIIDPIDGTRSFAAGNNDFCVSIGLAIQGQPVLGVVYAPATHELFEGLVSQPQPAPDSQQRRLCVSNTEYGRELQSWLSSDSQGAELLPSHSIALKLARVAYGQAEATFTVAPRSEWDICAGDAILRARGGLLRRRDGHRIIYNQPQPHIEQGIIGGFLPALNWLEPMLSQRRIPLSHMELQPSDPAWAVLSNQQQQRWHKEATEGNLHLRYLPKLETKQPTLDSQERHCFHFSPEQFLALIVTRREKVPTSEAKQAGEVNPKISIAHSEGDAQQLERLARNVKRLPAQPE